MGKVALKIRIMPAGADVDVENLREEAGGRIPSYAQIVNSEIIPIAFGLKALVLTVVMPDQSPDELVGKLEEMEGVESVNVEDVTLI